MAISLVAQLLSEGGFWMKHSIIFTLLVLLASIGLAPDNLAVEPTAAEQPEGAVSTSAGDAQPTSPLDELAWMVGKWVDQGEDATITTSCRWTKNRSFFSRSFKVTMNKEVTLEGTQVVGWDPIESRIRSWTFDSEGGFGEGHWTQDGNRWLVKTSYVLASGERASALNVFTYVDQNTFRWQSIDREIAGELQPNIPEVTVVRQRVEESESQQAQKEVSP